MSAVVIVTFFSTLPRQRAEYADTVASGCYGPLQQIKLREKPRVPVILTTEASKFFMSSMFVVI